MTGRGSSRPAAHLLASGAVLAGMWSAALVAQPGATAADPPPLAAEAGAAERRAWADRYVERGAYLETDMDADRVYLYDPASFARQPDGHFVGTIRAELFRPRTVAGITVRSVRKRAEIDCATLRYREIEVEGFAGANLQRPVPGLPKSDKWTPSATAGSGPGRRLFPACLDVAGFAKERAMRYASVKAARPVPQEAAIADLLARTTAMVAAAGATLGAVDAPPLIWRTSPIPLVVFDVPVGPRLVVIPAGEFTMGARAGEPGRRAGEGPRRRVRFERPLAVSMFPITYGEYSWFVAETRRPTAADCLALADGKFKRRPDADWYAPGFTQGGRSPATCVGYDDAVAYAGWLSQKTGQRYRLLTEAEYEYANRAGTTTAYWWGDDIAGGCALVDGFDQDATAEAPRRPASQCHDGAPFTMLLDKSKANPFGLFDTTGNVASWTSDCWRPGSRACTVRAVRGGSWMSSPPTTLRAAARTPQRVDEASAGTGFRVAREL